MAIGFSFVFLFICTLNGSKEANSPKMDSLFILFQKKLKPLAWNIQGFKNYQKWIKNESIMVPQK
jgi:hypothetical protein